MGSRLANKTALITGGASGIGRATALLFAEEGADVFVADRNLAPAEMVAAEVARLGRKAIAHQVDVSEESQVEATVARAVRELGRIDVLLCAAGVSHSTYGLPGDKFEFRPFTEKPLNEWRKVLSINLDGVFLTCRAVAREMIKAGRGGRIINISSIAAISSPGVSEYSVSKAGVLNLTRGLAVELAPYNITANAIGPGVIRTPMGQAFTAGRERPQSEGNPSDPMAAMLNRILLPRFGEPRDVANTVLFLASEEGAYFTGAFLNPDGGYLAS
jgi:NAD(P)-dependent dehydrogenase (short-subunit alcohol dehydrogenase family)